MGIKTIKLQRDERIVAVVPEYCAGPGWCNAPVWVYIVGQSGTREECIQPTERTPAMHVLFNAGAAMQNALFSAVPTRKAKKEKS